MKSVFAAIVSLLEPAREMYVLLTLFQSEMYFSMHCEMQVESAGVIVEPGVVMQLWKQFSLTL